MPYKRLGLPPVELQVATERSYRIDTCTDIGTAVGGGVGASQGAFSGPAAKAREQARDQITAMALERGDVRSNFTGSGYVFFPKGEYKQIQVLLVDNESGDTEVVARPWK